MGERSCLFYFQSGIVFVDITVAGQWMGCWEEAWSCLFAGVVFVDPDVVEIEK